jgi:hypothetical protein
MEQDFDEQAWLAEQARFEREEEQRELEEHAAQITAFQKFCTQKGIPLTKEHFSYVQTIGGIVATYPDLIFHIYPELPRDKDGLSDFHQLTRDFDRRVYGPGFLYGERFMLMAHPHFRRGHHPGANFAPSFLRHFWELNDPALNTRVAIDLNRVRINVDEQTYMEKDAWFGARFNQDIATISDGTSKYAPPSWLNARHKRFFFASAYALDIKWSTAGNIKSFQAEDFKAEDVTVELNGEPHFPARYIHAEFDTDTGNFRHFDGAIHFYDLDEYCERRDSDFNYNAKHNKQIKSKSKKIFRIDGSLNIETWMTLTSHFLTGNPLIHEYFEGKFPDYLHAVLEKLQQRGPLGTEN